MFAALGFAIQLVLGIVGSFICWLGVVLTVYNLPIALPKFEAAVLAVLSLSLIHI